MSDGVDRAADELYGLPLEEFVPRREELVRELRGAGQKDDAEMVKRMAKPSAPAWVVNQLARQEPEAMQDLLAAGRELRRVQDWLLRREAEPKDLRSAVEAERAAVGRLVRVGAAILTAAGRPPRGDVLERVGETLHAATAEPALRDEVARGRVVRDQAAVGLGPATGSGFAPAGATRRSGRGRARTVEGENEAALDPSDPRGDAPVKEPPSRGKSAKPGKPARPARSEPAGEGEQAAAARRKATQAARAELREAEAEAKAAERMRVAAERAVARATRSLTSAEASYERARDELQEAREELSAAEKAAAAAREAADAAQSDVVENRRRVDEADG